MVRHDYMFGQQFPQTNTRHSILTQSSWFQERKKDRFKCIKNLLSDCIFSVRALVVQCSPVFHMPHTQEPMTRSLPMHYILESTFAPFFRFFRSNPSAGNSHLQQFTSICTICIHCLCYFCLCSTITLFWLAILNSVCRAEELVAF